MNTSGTKLGSLSLSPSLSLYPYDTPKIPLCSYVSSWWFIWEQQGKDVPTASPLRVCFGRLHVVPYRPNKEQTHVYLRTVHLPSKSTIPMGIYSSPISLDPISQQQQFPMFPSSPSHLDSPQLGSPARCCPSVTIWFINHRKFRNIYQKP